MEEVVVVDRHVDVAQDVVERVNHGRTQTYIFTYTYVYIIMYVCIYIYIYIKINMYM